MLNSRKPCYRSNGNSKLQTGTTNSSESQTYCVGAIGLLLTELLEAIDNKLAVVICTHAPALPAVLQQQQPQQPEQQPQQQLHLGGGMAPAIQHLNIPTPHTGTQPMMMARAAYPEPAQVPQYMRMINPVYPAQPVQLTSMTGGMMETGQLRYMPLIPGMACQIFYLCSIARDSCLELFQTKCPTTVIYCMTTIICLWHLLRPGYMITRMQSCIQMDINFFAKIDHELDVVEAETVEELQPM